MLRLIHSTNKQLLVFSLFFMTALSAKADEKNVAKKHFDKAQIAYQLGKYLEAIKNYEAAYRALPEPDFIYNIAQSHRLQYAIDKEMVHLYKARSLYKTYLREVPHAPNRKTVEKMIDELQGQLATLEHQTQEKKSAKGTLVLKGEFGRRAKALLDGAPLGFIPLSSAVSAGPHLLEVHLKGYQAWSSTVNIPPESQVEIPVVLKPLRAPTPRTEEENAAKTTATPFYKTWWFLALTGSLLAGATGVGIYFATRSENLEDMPQVDLR